MDDINISRWTSCRQSPLRLLLLVHSCFLKSTSRCTVGWDGWCRTFCLLSARSKAILFSIPLKPTTQVPHLSLAIPLPQIPALAKWPGHHTDALLAVTALPGSFVYCLSEAFKVCERESSSFHLWWEVSITVLDAMKIIEGRDYFSLKHKICKKNLFSGHGQHI